MHAIEILDSRGRTTLSVTVALTDGTSATSGVPPGASTGAGEVVELRDADQDRYSGSGVLAAVGNVNGRIAKGLCGRVLAPIGAPSLAEAVRAGTEIYARLRRLLSDSGYATGLSDEGGFAPGITRPEDVLTLLVRAIDAAGYAAGTDGVAIALDPAASQFDSEGGYLVEDERLSSGELENRYEQMVNDGDDIFVSDAGSIRRASRDGTGNAALIKVNQIGTVSETLQAQAPCREVGFGCGQIKSGARARGERVAKYNRLLQIASSSPSLAFGIPRRGSRW